MNELKRKAPDGAKSLEDFGLSDRLLRGLEKLAIPSLTDIQEQALTKFKNDMHFMIKAETGSGKTLAYLLPLCNEFIRLSAEEKFDRSQGTQMLIICPTRELCIQIFEIAKILLFRVPWLVMGCVIVKFFFIKGGEDIKKEKARIRKGISVLICTPGRLIYHVKNTESFKISKLKAIVFDECDRTLDIGFERELNLLQDALRERLEIPFENLQVFFVSATLSKKLENFTYKIANKDKIIFVGDFENDKCHKVPDNLNQFYVNVGEWNRITLLLCDLKASTGKIMLFVSTIDEVEYFFELIKELFSDQFEILKLHGNIEQKDRSETYFKFQKIES